MPQPAHIIARQQVRLHGNPATDPIRMRSVVQALCTESLPVALSQLFDRYDEPGMVLRIEKISVDLCVDDTADLQAQLTHSILEQVELQLRQNLSKRIERNLSLGSSLFESFLHYLSNGYLPWWAIEKDATTFREAIQKRLLQDGKNAISPELRSVLRQPDAQQRFFSLIDEAVWTFLLEYLVPAEGVSWPRFIESFAKWLQTSRPNPRTIIQWPEPGRMILELAFYSDPSKRLKQAELIEAFVETIEQSIGPFSEEELAQLPHEVLQITFHKNHKSAKRKSHKGLLLLPQATDSFALEPSAHQALQEIPKTDTRILIANAGLVLLAPFLPAFFSNVGLAENEKLTEPERASLLLRQIYLGEENKAPFFEHEFVLEKILCGIPLSQGISSKINWTRKERNESEALLRSVISHWAALKNTSPDGLRFNFLRREGKLFFTRNEWQLRVQRQTQDILLDRLPWSISIIKLPWMKTWISVDWTG